MKNSRRPIRGIVWRSGAWLCAVTIIVLGVSWWRAGSDPANAVQRLRKSGASIVWVAGRIVHGDANSLSAEWHVQREQARWRRIEDGASAGMQLAKEGRYADAEARLRRELDMAKDLDMAKGFPQWYTILWMREYLGFALIAQRRYSEAQATYQQAADDIPPTASIGKSQNLAALLESIKPVDDKAALGLALWGLERSVESCGEDDPKTKGFKAKVQQLSDGIEL